MIAISMDGGFGLVEIIVLIIIFLILYFLQNKLIPSVTKIIKNSISSKNQDLSKSIIETDYSDGHSVMESNASTDDKESTDAYSTTIVQNITYNIQDSAISGDIDNEIKNN